MRRATLALCGLLTLIPPASAHFPWIVPSADGTKVTVVFSDSLEPDKNVPIAKLKALSMWGWEAEGKKGFKTLKRVEQEHAFEYPLAEGTTLAGGICKYGVIAKGTGDPFYLIYFPRAIVDTKPGPIPVGSGLKEQGPQAMYILLDPTRGGGKPHVAGFTVHYKGKPVPDSEVVVMVPGSDKEVSGKTDKDGRFAYDVDHNKYPGLYGVRASHVEKFEGIENNKAFKEIRLYATLVFRVAPAAKGEAKEGKQAKLPPNPEATKLLADARAARANWGNFPGFTADLTVNVDGVVHQGTVEVNETGKVKVTLADEKAHKWVLGNLRSAVSHRLDDSADRNTPCAFEDDNVHHPLGRKIRVLNDELHSSYRIRDRQIIEVNRQMPGSRFTITVLENVVNAEKKFLPSCYVVNTWDLKTGALLHASAFHQRWQRVGAFDLPGGVTVVDADTGTLGARTITLTQHKLLVTGR